MKLDKVTLFAATIGLLGWSLTDFLIHRANRLAAGDGVAIWQLTPFAYGIVFSFSGFFFSLFPL